VAIYSLHVKTVSRSAGRSVVAAATYRAAENIADERLGVVWDFTRKYGVVHSEIIAPANAPSWVRDRAELWNAAERAEEKSTRRDSATTGRDIILALPHELSDAQRIAAVQDFAAGLVDRYGVAVDFAIHAPDRHGDERNYHAHVLMTTRQIGANGLPEIFHSLAFELRFGSYLYEFLVPLLEQREIEAEGFDDAAGFGIAIAIAPALGIVAHDKDTGFLERAIEGLGAALGEPEKLRLVAQLGPCNGPAAFLPILRLFAVFRHEPIDEFVCVSW
jgi:hypothetical protein